MLCMSDLVSLLPSTLAGVIHVLGLNIELLLIAWNFTILQIFQVTVLFIVSIIQVWDLVTCEEIIESFAMLCKQI